MMVASVIPQHACACAGRKPSCKRTSTAVASASRFTFASDDTRLCPVSYSSSTSSMKLGRAMPAAARSAFQALERDTKIALARSRLSSTTAAAASTAGPAPAQSAIDTLCMVTYSDDEDAAASWQQQQRSKLLFSGSMVAAAATVTQNAGRAGTIFAALCSEDSTDESLPGVMETLCMLSYDEDTV